jgi:hypothetical protein
LLRREKKERVASHLILVPAFLKRDAKGNSEEAPIRIGNGFG